MKPAWNDIEILVVGAGTMGASLAQNYAQNGFHVGMLDVSDDAIAKGLDVIRRELESARGKIFSDSDIAAILSRIVAGTDYEPACRSSSLQIVIEAATERLEVKKEIFKRLDGLTAPHVLLATNSSSLDTNLLAHATNRPDKVVWMHYFYLPHKNRASEYAGTDTASDHSKLIARQYLKLGGKIPTYIRGSRKGGVADVIFVALLLEATRMLEDGYDVATIEAAGRKAYGLPMGFLQLMDVTGLPIGLYSMKSFSDPSFPNDPLIEAYGNFFHPRQNYIDLIAQYDKAVDKSTVRWIKNGEVLSATTDERTVTELADRFLAVGFLTSTECVNAGLISIEDLEQLTQNAFLWRKGPFTLMNELGPKRVQGLIRARAELAKAQGQDFPINKLLKSFMEEDRKWSFCVPRVHSEPEFGGAVRRITLSNPQTANALNNAVFDELKRAFTEANDDDRCKVIIFDTAPIKTFIAGADVRLFIERIRSRDFTAIRRDTTEWQHIMFHVMTGTEKPKIAIVDGQAFGGGVELACAFALDENSIVLITNRTSFTLPETRLGIYPGLRGTLTLPQLIFRQTKDIRTAVALARYYILSGTRTTSPQTIHALGCADAIVPQHRRDQAAEVIARALVDNNGRMISREELQALPFARTPVHLSLEELRELEIVTDLFSQDDVLPTLIAQGRGHQPLFYSGEMKSFAEAVTRRVANNSPHAVWIANYLIGRGFDGFLRGVNNDELAAFELEHFLEQVFEYPDALIGLEAMVNGCFPDFRRRYPL